MVLRKCGIEIKYILYGITSFHNDAKNGVLICQRKKDITGNKIGKTLDLFYGRYVMFMLCWHFLLKMPD